MNNGTKQFLLQDYLNKFGNLQKISESFTQSLFFGVKIKCVKTTSQKLGKSIHDIYKNVKKADKMKRDGKNKSFSLLRVLPINVNIQEYHINYKIYDINIML